MEKRIDNIRRRTWAEIDLDNARKNFLAVRGATPASAKVCCVIKANAYGHNAVTLGALYESLGADFLAVSNIEEALQLRRHGISLPILILGYTDEGCAKLLAENNVSQCVYSYEYAKALSKSARASGVKVKIHIKLDTGMGRIGFLCRGGESELEKALEVCRDESFITEGIFTHFPVADEGEEGRDFTAEQFKAFCSAVEYLEKNGVKFDVRHCSNSAAAVSYPEYALDMVRAGLVLYGMCPSEKVSLEGLVPVMSVHSVISHIKTVFPGESVSYGCEYVAEHEMMVATVPIGYADGFWRSNYKAPYSLLVNGKSAPIVGRVCMDQLMLDVTGIECSVGDRVTVFGSTEGNTAGDIARLNGTINYEVLCSVGERVPRAIVQDGEIIGWKDPIFDE